MCMCGYMPMNSVSRGELLLRFDLVVVGIAGISNWKLAVFVGRPGDALIVSRIGEHQPDRAAVFLRRAVGRVVHLEDELPTGGHQLGHARRAR